MSDSLPKTRAIAYLRVSTGDQRTANQIPDVRAALERDGATVRHDDWYEESETATGRRHRGKLEELVRKAERGEYRGATLYSWALDRLTREGPLQALLLVDRLSRAGVRVKSVTETWLDPASPVYELLLPIFAWIAKQEARRIGERTRAGLARARAMGVRLGRPPLAPEVVERMKVMHADGKSVRAIARALRISSGSVCKTLKKAATERQGLAAGSRGPTPA